MVDAYVKQAYIKPVLTCSCSLPNHVQIDIDGIVTMADFDATTERLHKTERIAVRLSSDAKRTLEHAARISGRSLTDFVVDNAVSAAQKAIEDSERMRLEEQDRTVFLAALADPPAPNEALKAAAARYRSLTE